MPNSIAQQQPATGAARSSGQKARPLPQRHYTKLADEMWERARDARDPEVIDAFIRLALAYSQMARMGAELAASGWPQRESPNVPNAPALGTKESTLAFSPAANPFQSSFKAFPSKVASWSPHPI